MMRHLKDQTARMQGYSKNEKESDGQKRETGGRRASGVTFGPLVLAVSGAQE